MKQPINSHSQQIAQELIDTALGKAYHGNALYVAKDIPVLNDEERWVIFRFLDGSQCSNDGRELQMIAHKIAAHRYQDLAPADAQDGGETIPGVGSFEQRKLSLTKVK